MKEKIYLLTLISLMFACTGCAEALSELEKVFVSQDQSVETQSPPKVGSSEERAPLRKRSESRRAESVDKSGQSQTSSSDSKDCNFGDCG